MRKFVGFVKFFQNCSREVDLISEQIISKKPLNNHVPVNKIKQILNKSFIELDGHFPEVDSCGKKRAQSLFHPIESLTIGYKIKFLNFSQVGISQFLKDILRFDSKFNRSSMMCTQNIQYLLQTYTIFFNNSIIFKLIYKLVLRSCIFQFM